jgi:hypothetical protein
MQVLLLILFGATMATSSVFANNKPHTSAGFFNSGSQASENDNAGDLENSNVKQCIHIAAKRTVTHGVNGKRYGAWHTPDRSDPSYTDTVHYCQMYASGRYNFDCLRGIRVIEAGSNNWSGGKKFLNVGEQPALTGEQIRRCSL